MGSPTGDISHIELEGANIPNTIREYDARLDTKKRLTLRNGLFEYYHVYEFEDGRIMLEPRELTALFQVLENTLTMMDEAILNMKAEEVSDVLDLSEFGD